MFDNLFLLCLKYFLSPNVNSLVSSANKKCTRYRVEAPHNVVKLLLGSSYSTLVSDIAVCLPHHFGISCVCSLMYLEYKIGLLSYCKELL